MAVAGSGVGRWRPDLVVGRMVDLLGVHQGAGDLAVIE
jgi:hypothetical protein